jgi:hypothetical protein
LPFAYMTLTMMSSWISWTCCISRWTSRWPQSWAMNYWSKLSFFESPRIRLIDFYFTKNIKSKSSRRRQDINYDLFTKLIRSSVLVDVSTKCKLTYNRKFARSSSDRDIRCTQLRARIFGKPVLSYTRSRCTTIQLHMEQIMCR